MFEVMRCWKEYEALGGEWVAGWRMRPEMGSLEGEE